MASKTLKSEMKLWVVVEKGRIRRQGIVLNEPSWRAEGKKLISAEGRQSLLRTLEAAGIPAEEHERRIALIEKGLWMTVWDEQKELRSKLIRTGEWPKPGTSGDSYGI